MTFAIFQDGAEFNTSSGCRYYCAYASQVYCCDDGSLTSEYLKRKDKDPPDTDLTEPNRKKQTFNFKLQLPKRTGQSHKKEVFKIKNHHTPQKQIFAEKKSLQKRTDELGHLEALPSTWVDNVASENTGFQKEQIRRKRFKREAEAKRNSRSRISARRSKRKNKQRATIVKSKITPINFPVIPTFVPTRIPLNGNTFMSSSNIQDTVHVAEPFREPPPLKQRLPPPPPTAETGGGSTHLLPPAVTNPTEKEIRYFEKPDATTTPPTVDVVSNQEKKTEVKVPPPNFESLSKNYPLFESAISNNDKKDSSQNVNSGIEEVVNDVNHNLESKEIFKRAIPMNSPAMGNTLIPLSLHRQAHGRKPQFVPTQYPLISSPLPKPSYFSAKHT